MYMFHGGTTRGFMNGANYNDKNPYEPQISSYDYDAPLDEAGNATAKFLAFRDVIKKNLPAGQTLPAIPAKKPAISIPNIKLTSSLPVLSNLPAPKNSLNPLTFEDLHQPYGFVLYRTKVQGGKTGTLRLNGLRDFAVVMVNGNRVGTLDRRLNQDSLTVTLPKGSVTLDILVENLGRINFGKYLLQNKKGLTGKVLFAGTELQHWSTYGLPFDNIQTLKYSTASNKTNQPVVLKGHFDLEKVGDTYLDMQDWGKGVVWINGHNLGRYWQVGPQQTVYVPVEWLKKKGNEIVVFEQLKPHKTISAIEKPILDKVNR